MWILSYGNVDELFIIFFIVFPFFFLALVKLNCRPLVEEGWDWKIKDSSKNTEKMDDFNKVWVKYLLSSLYFSKFKDKINFDHKFYFFLFFFFVHSLREVKESHWNPTLGRINFCWHQFWPQKYLILVSNYSFDEESSR